ncbi:MAG: hypothetical protein R3A45_04980 [Bdellovibrionota bacterium]
MQVIFRNAQKSDVAFIERCIHLLAEEEKFPGQIEVRQEDLLTSLFSEPPAVYVMIAEVDQTAVAFAMYYYTFSSTTGKKVCIWTIYMFCRTIVDTASVRKCSAR